MTQANNRTADHKIDPWFLERWSPRAFTGEAVPEADLKTILEAARWAPSSYNSQPWRFVYALRGTPAWDKLFSLLNEFNQSWAKTAGAVIVVVSKSTFQPPGADKEVPAYSASFDTGAAWAYLALQANRLGWAAHGLAGFDRDRAVTELGIPDGHRVEAAIVVGRIGDKSILPEALAARETPSGRNPVAQFAFNGRFGG